MSAELASKIFSEGDVIDRTRVQKERFSYLALDAKVKYSLTIEPPVMEDAKRNMILMYPLPGISR